MITNFLSSKLNLTILQCILYVVVGYLIKENYTWGQFIIVFILLFGIQFITHIKGVSHGMFIHQMMQEENHKIIKFLKKLNKDTKELDDDLPN